MRGKERAACTPVPVDPDAFNSNAKIPYGVTADHVRLAMEEFVGFLGFVNQQLHKKKIDRLESLCRPTSAVSSASLSVLRFQNIARLSVATYTQRPPRHFAKRPF